MTERFLAERGFICKCEHKKCAIFNKFVPNGKNDKNQKKLKKAIDILRVKQYNIYVADEQGTDPVAMNARVAELADAHV